MFIPYRHKNNFSLIFSKSECYLHPISLLNHVFNTCNSFSKENSSNILPNSSDLHHTLYEPHHIHQYAYQCPLKSSKHINKLSTLCVFDSPFNPSQKDCYIPNFFHFAEHAYKSASAHLLKNQHNCHYSITHPLHLHHLLTQLPVHHNSNTINPSFFPNRHIYTNIIYILYPECIHIASPLHPQHPRTMFSPSHLQQSTPINHPLSLFLTNFTIFSSISTHLPIFPSQSTTQSTNQAFAI